MVEQLLREPLVHFLLGGAALFAIYAWVGDDAVPERDRIVVDEAQVAALASSFERVWLRPPTRAELEGLVDDFVTEEILYREALELGLDRDDLVVRRRLRQKMEFLNEDLVTAREPSDEELRAYLAAHGDRFQTPARLSFRQVYIDPERPDPEARAAAVRERLTAGAAPDSLGDPTLLPAALTRAGAREVAHLFGARFAAELFDRPGTGWQDPISSTFGVHLVRIDEYLPAQMPALEEIRPAVAREWTAEQRAAANRRFHRALRDRYEIDVRLPAARADSVAAQGP